MRRIYLSQRKTCRETDRFAIVDDIDYERFGHFRWSYSSTGPSLKLAIRNDSRGPAGKTSTVAMHREIMSPPKGLVVTHLNRDGLDNRRSNLRVCTMSEATMNRGDRQPGMTGYYGVYYRHSERRFRAVIINNGSQLWLGQFKTAEAAARAYNEASLELRGEYGLVNDI